MKKNVNPFLDREPVFGHVDPQAKILTLISPTLMLVFIIGMLPLLFPKVPNCILKVNFLTQDICH